MRRYFEKTLARLRAFVAQRKNVLLLVRVRDEHGLVIVRQLEALAEVSPHFFWSFAEPFTDARQYAGSIAAAFRARVARLNEKLAAKGTSWPPLPDLAFAESASPVARIRALTVYARDRIPDTKASNLVLALLPSQVADPLAYRLFLRAFTAFETHAPWCHHVRIVAREPLVVSTEALTSHLREALAIEAFPSTEVLNISLAPDDLYAALEEEIDDESAPIPERAQSLFVAANIDVSHGRHEEAIGKLKMLEQYYEDIEPVMYAATLNALGEATRAALGFTKALPTFESALHAAMRARCLPVMLNVCLNVATGHFAARQWASAAEYLETADTIAAATLNVEVKLQCLERLGICRFESEAYAAARTAWLGGCELARFAKNADALRRFLCHLRDLYAAARMPAELDAVEREIAEIR